MENLTDADEGYHIAAKTVLSLAQRAEEIFERSKPAEKRQLLGYLLQNPTVSGKTLGFTLRKPFDVLVEAHRHPDLLRMLRDVRAAKIEEYRDERMLALKTKQEHSVRRAGS